MALLLSERISKGKIFSLFGIAAYDVKSCRHFCHMENDVFRSIRPLNYFFKVLGLSDGRTEWLAIPNSHSRSRSCYYLDVVSIFILILLAAYRVSRENNMSRQKIDGASWWNELRYITLPNLLPSIMVVVLVRFLDALKTFALVYTLTGGGPGSSTELIYYEIFRVAFRDFNIGYASSLSIIVGLVSILACGLILKLSRKYASYEY